MTYPPTHLSESENQRTLAAALTSRPPSSPLPTSGVLQLLSGDLPAADFDAQQQAPATVRDSLHHRRLFSSRLPPLLLPTTCSTPISCSGGPFSFLSDEQQQQRLLREFPSTGALLLLPAACSAFRPSFPVSFLPLSLFPRCCFRSSNNSHACEILCL